MSNVTTEYVNDHDKEWKDSLTMAIPAAKFLLRALQDLRLVDDTITVDNLQAFAGTIIGEMDLMIGSEKMLKELFGIQAEIDFIDSKNHTRAMEVHNRNAEQLSEKILQAQQNLITNDRDFPF